MDDSPPAADSSADTGAVDDSESTDNSTQDEPVSVFLPKAALGGQECKPGDKLTLTVRDVDSETGDAECVVDYGDKNESDDEGSMSASFDRAMPPEQ